LDKNIKEKLDNFSDKSKASLAEAFMEFFEKKL
jgi:hypothetical protein